MNQTITPPRPAVSHVPPSQRHASLCRWIATLVTVSAAVLLPWIAYLAFSLPSTVSARHWPLAWAGLDTAMAIGLAATGWLALRRDRRIAFCAASTATVLVVDAWFDVCTSPAGQPFALALVDGCIELGEAAACLVLGWLVWRDLSDRFQRLRQGGQADFKVLPFEVSGPHTPQDEVSGPHTSNEP